MGWVDVPPRNLPRRVDVIGKGIGLLITVAFMVAVVGWVITTTLTAVTNGLGL